jgi:hypothetical protein
MSSSCAVKPRLRAFVTLAVMVALTGVTGAGIASGAPRGVGAQPDQPVLNGVDLTSTVDATVTSTTKHKLLLAFASDYQSDPAPNARGSDSASDNAHGMTVTLTTGGRVGEEHSWYFPVSKNKLTYSSSGHGKLAATSFGAYGRVKLALTASGKTKTKTCSVDDFIVTRYVVVRGTLLLNTHSKGKHRWGSVGGTHFRSTHRWELDEVYGNGCYDFPPTPCFDGVNWSTQDMTTAAVRFFGDTTTIRGKHVGLVEGSRAVSLRSPKGAVRYDSVEAESPAPSYTEGSDGSQTVSVTTRGHLVTGSATLSNGAPSDPVTEESPCKTAKGESGVESFVGRDAAFVVGSKGLTAHEQVFGSLRARLTSSGGIEHFTYSLGPPD